MGFIGRIDSIFQEHLDLLTTLKKEVAFTVLEASKSLVSVFLDGHKVLVCGNGGSASDSQHFVGELVNKFQKDRPGLPAIALTSDISVLTSISNDLSYEAVFSRQVSALGAPGDALVVLSTSGNSKNIIQAVRAAHTQGMHVIALIGRNGDILHVLTESDTVIRVNSYSTPRIQEMHLLILHAICDVVDTLLLGNE